MLLIKTKNYSHDARLSSIALMSLASLLSSLYSLCLSTSPTSAYTASITTGSSIELDVSSTGTSTSIEADSIHVTSDCRNGYNLTVATPSGSDLYKYSNNTQASTASFTAVDGTSALSSDNNNNKWGYSVDTNPTSSTVFNPLSTTASIIKTPTQTASPSSDINDTFNVYYGIKVDNTIDPGTYKMATSNNTIGSIVYYLTMDTTCTQYTVEFNPNGGTVASGATNPVQGISVGEPTKLDSSTSLTAPTTSTYTDADNNTITGDPDKLWTFWGWNTAADGTGDWYKDREQVEDLTTAGSTITLYAQWKQATLNDLTAAPAVQPTDPKQIDHNTMQDMSPETCYNSDKFTAIGTPYGQATLTDNRDGVTRSYRVAKLPDDACWMTDNLNLGTSTDITLTSDDSDLAEDTTFTLPASNPSDFSTSATKNNYNKATVLNNMTIPDYTVNSTYSGKIGAYYSFAAATADINTYDRSTGVVATSICPKNWDLPSAMQYYNLRTKGSIATYNNTNSSYTGKNAGNEPYYFIYGGYRKAAGNEVNTTYFSNPTSYGYLWTSNNSTYRYGYGTSISSSGLYNSTSGTTYYKYNGLSMRCVASQGTATINYDGNGTNEYPVTGTVASQNNVEIASTNTQQGTGFTRTNWAFSGWNTAPDGSGTAISANASIATLNLKPGDTITLYAQWLPQYTITYVNNCMTYASTNSACTQPVSDGTSDQKINLTNNPSTGTETGTLANYNNSNAWNITGWKIKGWSTVANNSDNSNIEYRAGTTYTVPSGSGVGSGITLYAHWVPVYSIQYDGNNADNPNGMGTTDQSTGVKSVKQTNVGEGDPVTLLASNFKKAENGFAGWSTDPDAWTHFTDNDSTNDPVIYGPMETISAPAYPTNGTNIITMYAVWVPAEKDGNNNPVYLQDWNSCASLNSASFNSTTGVITATKDSIIALTDKRDDEVYTIAKLADDHCWMIENLRLEHEGTVGNNKNDGNVTNESLSQGYGGTPGTYGNFVGLATSESDSIYHLSTTANSIYKSSANPPVDTYDSANNVLEDIGTSNYPAFRFPRYNNSNNASALSSPTFTENYANASSPSTSGTYKTSTVSSYGNYYTWAAAMANTNYYESLSTSEAADTSICPSGWHLPTSGTTSKEYSTLSQRYGGNGRDQSGVGTGDIMSNRFRTFPNNFLYSGYFGSSSAGSRGSGGSYWSRSASSYSNSYYLSLYSATLSPSYNTDKIIGHSVRCLIDYSYTIQYDGNGADNPNGMGTTDTGGKKSVKQTEITEGISVNLLPSNFKRAGYGFAGWSTDPDAWTHFTDDDSTNDPVIYGPMETITAPARTGRIMTLYAVWVPAEKDGSNNPVYLQEWDDPTNSTDGCAALTSTSFNSTTGKITTTKDSIIALTDKRDDEVYTIAKLADDNCWMTENLRLEHEGTVGNNKNDGNVTNESLSQGYGGTTGTYGNFVGLAASESANFSNSTTSLSFADGGIYKSSANPPVDTYDPANNVLEDVGTSNYPFSRFPRYNNSNNVSALSSPTFTENYANVSSPSTSGTYKTSTVSSYGNYYTWAAAMANTNYYESSSISEAAGTSICPSGWHLPSSSSASKEYGTLSQRYGGTGNYQSGTAQSGDIMSKRFRSFPNNFLYSGYFYGSSADTRGSYGYYWSRSAYGSTNSYRLYLYSTILGPSNFDVKLYGFSVRCLVGS